MNNKGDESVEISPKRIILKLFRAHFTKNSSMTITNAQRFVEICMKTSGYN